MTKKKENGEPLSLLKKFMGDLPSTEFLLRKQLTDGVF